MCEINGKHEYKSLRCRKHRKGSLSAETDSGYHDVSQMKFQSLYDDWNYYLTFVCESMNLNV